MTRSLLVACRCRRSSRSMKLRSSDGSPGYSHCPPCSSSHVSAQANDSHHTTTHRQRLPPLPQSSPKPDASSHLCTCRGWAHHTGWEDEKTANGSIDRFARKKLRYLSSPQLLLLSLTTAQLPLNYCSTTAQLPLNYCSTTTQLSIVHCAQAADVVVLHNVFEFFGDAAAVTHARIARIARTAAACASLLI